MKEQPHELIGRLFGAYVSSVVITCGTCNNQISGGHSAPRRQLQVIFTTQADKLPRRAGSLQIALVTIDENYTTGKSQTLATIDMLNGPETDALLDSFKS